MKRTKRFLAMLLSILLIATSMPLAAFAAGGKIAISSVTITAPQPVAGEPFSYDFSVADDANYSVYTEGAYSRGWCATDSDPQTYSEVSNDDWYYLDTTQTFEAGKYYTCHISIQAKDGYTFAVNRDVTVNGKKALTGLDQNGILHVYATFYVSESGGSAAGVIKSISILNVTEPVTGEEVSFEYAYPNGVDYVGNGANWYVTDEWPQNFSVLDSAKYVTGDTGATFKGGKYYTFVAHIRLNDGYEVAEDVSVTVNGEQALLRVKDGDYQVARTFYTEASAGMLTINQWIAGELTSVSNESFSYYITDSDDNTTIISQKLNGSKDNLSVELESGTYTITPKAETIDGFKPTVAPASAEVTIEKNKITEVTFTNHYTLVDASDGASDASTVTLYINKTYYDMDGVVKASDSAPVIVSSRTFVPFRLIAEAFGAEVSWNATDRSVISKLDDVTVTMWIGSQGISVDSAKGPADGIMDVAPYINSANRTMVPVRFVAEALGCEVTPYYAADGTTERVVFTK